MRYGHHALSIVSILVLLVAPAVGLAEDTPDPPVTTPTPGKVRGERTVLTPGCTVSGDTYLALYLGLLVCEGWAWTDNELENDKRRPGAFRVGGAARGTPESCVQLGN